MTGRERKQTIAVRVRQVVTSEEAQLISVCVICEIGNNAAAEHFVVVVKYGGLAWGNGEDGLFTFDKDCLLVGDEARWGTGVVVADFHEARAR